jgi:hypothetical protein
MNERFKPILEAFMRVRVSLFAAACSLAALSSMASAQITGKVTLNGKAPEPKIINMSAVKDCAALHPDPVTEENLIVDDKNDIANVVVAIKADDPTDNLGGSIPKEPVVLDQRGCMYHPHVIAMMCGQEFLVKNSDGFLHNVQSLADKNPGFNRAQPSKNNGEKVESPKVPEIFKLKCQVHPWMGAYVTAFAHPFFAVTKEDGTFAIPKGLPDGDYNVEAWQEELGTKEGKVTVKNGVGTVSFVFDMK